MLLQNKTLTRWKCIDKAKSIWFELFYWQEPFWKRWCTTLFSISTTEYILKIANTKYISSWQPKGLSNKIIKPPTSDNSLNPTISYYGTKARLEFRGSCLKQDKSTFNHGKIVNIYIVYELDKTYVKTNPMLVNCLFGADIDSADIDKNKYSRYGTGFDRSSVYLLLDGSFGRYVVIFGVDMSSSVHVDNKGKDF